MGLRLETYNNGTANLIVSFIEQENNNSFYSGDSVQEAIDYFHLFIDVDTNELRIPGESELALKKLNISADEATEFRKNLNSMLNVLSDEDALKVGILYSKWSGDGVKYEVNNRVRYLGDIYKVIKAHTSTSELTPNISSELFENISKKEVVPVDWVSTEIYNIGAQVIYNGSIWESLIDNNNNVEPGTDDAIWELIGIIETEFPIYNPEIIYSIGEKVVLNGLTYVSLIDNNTYSPVDNPTAWELVQ